MTSYREISLLELTTPRDGFTVLLNRWWATQNGNPIACCHRDRYALLTWATARGLDVTFIPVAYWPEKVICE